LPTSRSGDATHARISPSEESQAPTAAKPPDEGNSHESSDAESAAAITAPITDEHKLAACGAIIHIAPISVERDQRGCG
jgi:hypothetical protein